MGDLVDYVNNVKNKVVIDSRLFNHGSATSGIQEAIGSLAGPGIVDARGLVGSITVTSTINIPSGVSVLLGSITITGPSNEATFVLSGSYARLIGSGAEVTKIKSALTSGDVIQIANSNQTLFIQNCAIKDLSIVLTAGVTSANGVTGYAVWYSLIEGLYVYTAGGTSTGSGVQLTDTTTNATAQGAYFNTIRRCFIGNNNGTGLGSGIYLNASTPYQITIVNIEGCVCSYNSTNLLVGGITQARWVTVSGGAFIYGNIGINLVYSDQVHINDVDLEGNTTWCITGTITTEVFVTGAMGSTFATTVNPALNYTKLWDASDHAGTNRGEIDFFGATPAFLQRNNGFTQAVRTGINYDGATYEIGWNVRSLSANSGNLIDITQPGAVFRFNNAGLNILTATAGANPRTLTNVGSLG